MYFGVHWKEDRLMLPPPESNNSGAEWVPIDLEFMEYLWVPNIFVYDIAEFNAIECLKRLAGIWVVKDKELFYNQVSQHLINQKNWEGLIIKPQSLKKNLKYGNLFLFHIVIFCLLRIKPNCNKNVAQNVKVFTAKSQI